MAMTFGRKPGTAPGKAGQLHAKPMPSWRDKAGLQQPVIVEGIHGYLVDSHNDARGLQVHAVLNAVGRLAGFSAQYVVWQKATGSADPCVASTAEVDRELTVSLMLGRPHRYVPQVNAYILPAGDTKASLHGTAECLWSVAGAAVTAAGGQPMALEQVLEIFERAREAAAAPEGAVAASLGPAVDLNLCQWPIVKCLLQGFVDFEGTRQAVPPLAPVYWPLALAEVAARLIGDTKGRVEPVVALRMVLEAAVPATMVDPKQVPASAAAAQEFARSRRELADTG